MKNITLKIFYLLLTVVIISSVGVFLFRSKLFASDLGGGDQQMVNFGGIAGSKTVRVSISGNSGKIEIENNLFSACSGDLTGFQNEAKIRGVITLAGEEKAVELSGPAGAHAENRQYFFLDQSFCPKPLAFDKAGTISYNIYSDEPSFLLQDFNADGLTDVAAEYRNYDLDPIFDGTRDLYFYNRTSRKFEFSNSESFAYPQN